MISPRENEAFFEQLQPGQMLEVLFDAIPGAHLFVKDRKSRFVAASRSFARTLGCHTLDAILGKTDHDFSADFLADAFRADDEAVMRSGQPILNKVELVPTEDSLDWLTTTKIPLYDRNGFVVGLAGVTRRTQDSEGLYRDHPEMHRIVDRIRQRFREKLRLADFAEVAGCSVSSVERLFRRTFGMSPMKYVKKVRLNAACQGLRETNKPIAAIAQECGFTDQTAMNRDFRAELKLTPRKYRLRFTNATRRTPAAQGVAAPQGYPLPPKKIPNTPEGSAQ